MTTMNTSAYQKLLNLQSSTFSLIDHEDAMFATVRIATIGYAVKRGTWANTNSSIYQYNRQFLEKLRASV